MIPLVSVIIPVYKTEKFLDECIESVINQSYKNLEIILVDDGSPDRCAEICDNYKLIDRRIKVIHKDNGGLSSARNAGIDRATGEFITFIDSDDIVNITMIEQMQSTISSYNADIVKVKLIRTDNAKAISTEANKKIEVTTGIEALHRIYSSQPQIISACGKLYKRSLFNENRFPEGIIHEDEYIMPKLFYQCDKIVFLDNVLYYYMQRDNDSIMRSVFSKKKMDVIYVMEDRIQCFKKWKLYDLYAMSIKDYYYHLLRLFNMTNNNNFHQEHIEVIEKLKLIDRSYLGLREKFMLRRLLK